MPVSRKNKIFTITNIPGCGPDEVVFARSRFTVGDQEAINNQLLAMSINAAKEGAGAVDMQANFGAIKRATITQLVESWTLKEEIEIQGGVAVVPLPQITEDAEIVSQLDIEVADYLFLAIQTRKNPGEVVKTPEEQEAFLTSADAASSAS